MSPPENPGLPVDADAAQAPREPPLLVIAPAHDDSILEGLPSPIVIISRKGTISFMNGAARRLLVEGLDGRLASHICANPSMPAVTQVHFRLKNGHDLVLKIRLGEIDWLGEKATQISISNVTPYLARIQELQQELGKQKRAAEDLANRMKPEGAAAVQPEALASELAAARQETELAVKENREREMEFNRIKKELAAQVQALQSNLSAATGEREELRRQIADRLAADSSARAELSAEIEARQSLEKEVGGLRHDLAAVEQARSEQVETFEKLKGEVQGHAKALACARAEAAEACRNWEAERAGLLSRTEAAGALLEAARQQAAAEASQRSQVQTDLEKALAAAVSSEQIRSELRRELETVRRALEQLGAREKEQASHFAELLEENARLKRELAEHLSRESTATAAREALEEKAKTLACELATARQDTERAVKENREREMEFNRIKEKSAAETQALQSELSAVTAEREELRRQIADRLAADSSARAELSAEIEARQSLEKEVAGLRQDLAAAEQARSEQVETFEKLKGEVRGHAKALACARAEAAAACRNWEAERAGLLSRAEAAEALLEGARQQAAAEASQRSQVQTDLEMALAAAVSSEQIHSGLRRELETVRGALEQLSAREKEQASHFAQLLEGNARLKRELAEHQSRESASAAAREALEEKAKALASELAAARQDTERAVKENREREMEFNRIKEELAAQVQALQSNLSAATGKREELRRQIADQLSADSSARAAITEEVERRQALEKEVAGLRHDLAIAEQARQQWAIEAKVLQKLNREVQIHAKALADAHEEAADVARLAKGRQSQTEEAEGKAAPAAVELEQAGGTLKRRLNEAQAAEKVWARERPELRPGGDGALDAAAMHTGEEPPRSSSKLDGETQPRPAAQQKTATEAPRSEGVLGPYRLTEDCAVGQIARICKGIDRTTEQKVLIRVVEPLVCRNERLRAVLEGLRDPASPRRVQDPHILKLLDVGIHGDSYYVVHEDFGGVPLDEYVKESRPSLKEALALARAIAECVRAVHACRHVHGDLKPQNILVARDAHGRPVVKVALADLAHDAADATISIYDELVATPKYLSPEQIRGTSATPGSDLFSLGVIFYELFSGREPFPAQSPIGHLHGNVSVELRPLSTVDPAVPPDLSAIVERLLARQPHFRYRTVQALLDDLGRVETRLAGVGLKPVLPGTDSAFAPTPSEAPASASKAASPQGA